MLCSTEMYNPKFQNILKECNSTATTSDSRLPVAMTLTELLRECLKKVEKEQSETQCKNCSKLEERIKQLEKQHVEGKQEIGHLMAMIDRINPSSMTGDPVSFNITSADSNSEDNGNLSRMESVETKVPGRINAETIQKTRGSPNFGWIDCGMKDFYGEHVQAATKSMNLTTHCKSFPEYVPEVQPKELLCGSEVSETVKTIRKTSLMPSNKISHKSRTFGKATQEMLNNYDRIPVRRAHRFAFKPEKPIRKKDERAKLPGRECDMCKDYYTALANDHTPSQIQKIKNSCSRHRSEYPQKGSTTPPHFWDVDFPSTQECIDTGILGIGKRDQSSIQNHD